MGYSEDIIATTDPITKEVEQSIFIDDGGTKTPDDGFEESSTSEDKE